MNVTTEARLVVAIREGNATANDDLILGHRNMIFNLAKKHARSPEHKQDLIGIGSVALCESVETFVGKKQACRFSTYAYQRIDAAIIHSLRTSKGVLSATEWEGRTDSRLQRQYTELAQELGREPTLQEFSFVYGEEMHEQPQETGLEYVDSERSVQPLNGYNVDFERMPSFARIIVDEIQHGASSNVLAEVSANLSVSECEIQQVLQIAREYIHFS
jgi:RNA polymerase sigma factor (sigma-70 family)